MFNEEKFHNLTVIANERFKEKHYWLEKLSGDLVKVTFPYDRKEPAKDKRQIETVKFKLEQALFERLMEVTGGSDYTLAVILITGLVGLIYKYTGNDDIIIGAPIVKQDNDMDMERQTGYLNTFLPLRHRLNPRMTFKEMLMMARQTFIEANENQNYPLEVLIHNLDMEYRENGNFPLFDILVLLENIQEKEYARQINTGMVFGFRRLEECIVGELEFDSSLYKPTTINGIVTHFTVFLQQALDNVEEYLDQIEFMSRKEKQHILSHFSGMYLDYPREKTIHELFVQQAQRTPDNKALVYQEEEITYGELNKRSGQLSWLLRSKGINSNRCAAVMAERSIEIIVAILAILKAGGAYLPIATNYPPERVRYVLQDSGVEVLFACEREDLCQPSLCERLDPRDVRLYGQEEKSGKIPGAGTAKDLAYIIYTSGSTGKPKGSLNQHQSLVNLVHALREMLYKEYSGNLNVALVAPLQFDASVQQVFSVLFQGYALYILPDYTRLDGVELLRYLKKHSIDICDGTPSHLRLLLELLKGGSEGLVIKRFIIGGEALTAGLAADFIDSFAASAPVISNIYGTAETCVDSVVYDISEEELHEYEIIPIGKPMPNGQIYILNQAGRPQPPGIAGELCIGGDGIGRGYLNNPELTSQKFVRYNLSNIFPKTSARKIQGFNRSTRSRIYRTGDLARWLPEGNIQFLERIDNQVKIRGLRVELGEIQNQLVKYPGITDAEVIVKTREQIMGRRVDKDEYLCAYIISPTLVEVGEVKEYLSREFPDYMIPSYFVLLEKLPLTANGKLDMKALPNPEMKEGGEEYIAPGNETQRRLVKIWSDVLKIPEDSIGIHANFFQLGGHSLNIAVAAAQIHRKFEVSIPIIEIFDNPTIEKLAKKILVSEKDRFESIEPREKKEYYQLSSAQKRLYVLYEMEPGSLVYNIPHSLVWEGELQVEKIKNVFNTLIKRHESLRTSFKLVDNEPVQMILDNVEIEIWNYNINEVPAGGISDASGGHTSENREPGAKSYIEDLIRPFNLSCAPLMRIGLVKSETGKITFLFDMHHIISDATSQEIFTREFVKLYEGEELSALKLQYRDYAEWQECRDKTGGIKEQEKYWLDRFKDQIPVLNLPTDYPRPMVRSFQGNHLNFTIGHENVRALKELASREDITIYMMLMAIFYIFLSKISGQEDIVMGTVVEGRSHGDLREIVGMFVNTLALRNFPIGEKRFKEFLGDVKQRTLKAFENQDYPFEDLAEKVSIVRDIGRNPIFDVMFSFQGENQQSSTVAGVQLDSKGIRINISKFDLSLEVVAAEDWCFTFEYSEKLFKQETIQWFMEYIKEIISCIVKNPDLKLSEIEAGTGVMEHDELSQFMDDLENE